MESQNLEKKQNKNVELSQCTVKPNIDFIKEFASPDLSSDNVVQLEKEATSLIKGKTKGKSPGKPVLPCSFGGTSYYGLRDFGSSINVIPYSLYEEIHDNICPSKIRSTDMTIRLANRTFKMPYGVLHNVHILIGSFIYPIDLVVMDMPQDSFCPIIFGRSFLNTAHANIDCKKETVSLKFG